MPAGDHDQDLVARLRHDVLASAASPSNAASDSTLGADSGLAVLASLAAAETGSAAEQREVARAAVHRWLGGYRDGVSGYNLFGLGMAGMLAGLEQAIELEPRLFGLAVATRTRLVAWSATRPWRTDGLDWDDYDLISGPSGMLLALAAGGEPADLVPVAEQLAGLCTPELDRLRVSIQHPGEQRAANLGRVNTGLGHGVPGVVAALTAAVRVLPRADFAEALATVSHWLIEHQVRDDRGIIGWRPIERADQPVPPLVRPQVWCYGTPGIAYMLWEAGQVLSDPVISDFALEAMASLCPRWEPELYLSRSSPGSHLTICHGAAGVLAIADAFARHAEFEPAAELRTQLTGYLHERLDELAEHASADLTLLTGTPGVLAVLCSAGGGPRGWLGQLGLR